MRKCLSQVCFLNIALLKFWFDVCFVFQVQFPLVLKKTAMSRLWYKPDTKFSTPKACIKIHFNCPESSYSPEASVSTKIFTKLLVDYLNEYGAFSAPILNCLFRAVRILIICSIQFDALYKKVWPRFISNLPQFCFLCSC